MKLDSLSDLNTYISFVVLSAPSKFPRVGPFTGDEINDLSQAFLVLKSGVRNLGHKLSAESMDLAAAKFEAAHQAYRSGDALKGAHLLQDVQDVLFPNRFAEHR